VTVHAPEKPNLPVVTDAVVECPHGAECPGCPLLSLPYGAQLATKRKRVEDAIRHFPELGAAWIADIVAADPIVSYRTRAKLVASGPLLGLYARGTHRVVDIAQCRVQDPEVFRVADGVRRHLPHGVTLRAVDLQRATDGVFVTLVVPDRTDEALVRKAAEDIARDVPGIAGVAVSYRDERSHQVLGRAPVPLLGSEREKVRVLGAGAPFHFVAPGGFTQAHRGQQRAMIQRVLAEVAARFEGRKPKVLDIYSGAGALALSLAARGARVVAVESYAPAAALARAAAEEQRLDVRVEATDAADAVHDAIVSAERPDVVIVNPPRRGLSPATRAGIARLSPELVVYVSCEPVTLGRDLADFARHGLSLRSLVPFDMMPQTEEVESLAVLERAERPLPIVLHRDERLIAVMKSPHEPTIPQGEHSGSLLDRVRRLEGTGGHSLVAVRPDEGRKHQIRRHFASLGHPVIGDERYGDPRTNDYFAMKHFLDRPFLHCARIALDIEGHTLELTASLDQAPDLVAVLESLGGPEADSD
jgi:23S rRNA (uracil1939-C5)-methyltransferase